MSVHPARPAPRRERRRRAVGLALAAAAVLASATVPVGAAVASGKPATVRYAVARPACSAPARGQVGCFAVRLSPTTKGTPGAEPVAVPTGATGPEGGHTPADLAAAYGYDPDSTRAAGQTVAIVDAYDDPNARHDLDVFDTHYGLPAETSTSFRKVNQYGRTSPLPAPSAGWSGEIALDIEAARAVCHRCRILLVEARSASMADLATAVNTAAALGATEISNSYGAAEYPAGSASIRSAYDHPGIVVTASTGDDGWYDWDLANEGRSNASDNVPNAPSSYPSVVAVGGTTWQPNGTGRPDETVWNGNGVHDAPGFTASGWHSARHASGGGCSQLYPAPSWQRRAAGFASTGCDTFRLAGDVAALGDPYTGFDTYDSYGYVGWGTIGGTSLSSPLIAAMWALAGGAGGAAYPAQSLYDHLAYTPASLYDVTAGGNGFCGGEPAADCSAAVLLTSTARSRPTHSPNYLYNGNPYYQQPFPGWAGMLDCGFALDDAGTTTAANTQCNATTGYDGPSGVGTPNGLTAFRRMGPSVTMSAPSLLRLNTTATFRASAFSDSVPGAALARYRWLWGDGTATTTTGAAVSHRYTARGTYSIRLTSYDTKGHYYTVTRRAALGYTPSVSISGRTSIHPGRTYAWYARTVERNTGGVITSRVWRIGSRVWSHSTALRHAFRYRGQYRVSLTVTDSSGLRSTRTVTVRVS